MDQTVREEIKVEPVEVEEYVDEEGVVVKEEPLEEYSTYINIIVKDNPAEVGNEDSDDDDDDEEQETEMPRVISVRTVPSRRTRSSQHLFPPLNSPVENTSSTETLSKGQPPLKKTRNSHLKKGEETPSSFFSKLDLKVGLAIKEALALQINPRSYHRFYFIIHSNLQDGVKKGLIQEGEEVDQLWEKYDKLAFSEFEKANGQVPPDAEELLKKRTWGKRKRGKNMKKTLSYKSTQRRASESRYKKLWSYAFEQIIACDAKGTTVNDDLECRRQFYVKLIGVSSKKQAFLNSIWTALLTLKKDEIKEFIQGGGGCGTVLISSLPPPLELKTEADVLPQPEPGETEPEMSKKDNLHGKTNKTKILNSLRKKFKQKNPSASVEVEVNKTKVKMKPEKPAQTPEEIAFQRKMNLYLWKAAQKAKMSPEEWEEKQKKILERKRMLNAVKTPDRKQAEIERNKQWRNSLPEDKKKRYRESVYKSIKKYNSKLKETNPEKYKERYEKLINYQRHRVANETPEQRQKRLLRYKVNQARRRAKIEMEKNGMAPEEIERRLEEVKREVEEREANKPKETHQYRPRVNGRKSKVLMELKEKLQQPSKPLVKEVIPPPEVKPTPAPEVEPTPAPEVEPTPPYEVNHLSSPDLNIGPSSPMYQDDNYDDHDDHYYDDNYYEPAIPQNVHKDGRVASYIDLKTEFVSVSQASTSLPDVSGLNSPSTPPTIETPNIKVLEAEPPPIPSLSTGTTSTELPKSKKYIYSSSLIICEECGISVQRRGMTKHRKIVHNKDPSIHKCPKCDAEYDNSKGLWLHYNNIHEEENVSATTSSTNFTHKTTPHRIQAGLGSKTLKKQDSQGSRDGPFPCDQCEKQFKQRATLDDHIRRVHMGLGFFCEVCGKEEQTATKLWRHKKEKHGVDEPPPVQMVICEYCGEYVLRSYEQHVQRRHPEKYDEYLEGIGSIKPPTSPNVPFKLLKVKCPKCHKEIMHGSLKRHLRSVHKQARKSFLCQQCGVDFPEMFRLTEHIIYTHNLYAFVKRIEAMKLVKSHKDNTMRTIFVCSICDMKIGCSIDMGGHLLANHFDTYEQLRKNDDSVWKCEECSAAFSCESLFSSHLMREHPQKIYFCGALCCLKLFSDVESLTLHRKSYPECSGYVEKTGRKKRASKRKKKQIVLDTEDKSEKRKRGQKQTGIKSKPKKSKLDVKVKSDDVEWNINVKFEVDSDAVQRKSTRKRKNASATASKLAGKGRDAKLDKVVKVIVKRLTHAEILSSTNRKKEMR